jgi:hypothetical protein
VCVCVKGVIRSKEERTEEERASCHVMSRHFLIEERLFARGAPVELLLPLNHAGIVEQSSVLPALAQGWHHWVLVSELSKTKERTNTYIERNK